MNLNPNHLDSCQNWVKMLTQPSCQPLQSMPPQYPISTKSTLKLYGNYDHFFPQIPPLLVKMVIFLPNIPQFWIKMGLNIEENTSFTLSHTNSSKCSIWPQNRREKPHEILGMRAKKSEIRGKSAQKGQISEIWGETGKKIGGWKKVFKPQHFGRGIWGSQKRLKFWNLWEKGSKSHKIGEGKG